MPSQEDEIRALQKARSESKGTALGAAASSEFDRDLYGGAKGLSREIVDEPSQDDNEGGGLHPSTQRDLRGPADEDDGEDPFKAHRDRNPRAGVASANGSWRSGLNSLVARPLAW